MSIISEKSSPLTDRDRATIGEARAAARVRFAQSAAGFADEPAGDTPGSVDPENPPMTEARLAALRPAADVVPGLVAARLRRKTGSGDRRVQPPDLDQFFGD